MSAAPSGQDTPAGAGDAANAPGQGPLLTMTTLKTRSDFLRAASGRKAATPGLVLQMCATPAPLKNDRSIRIGFTASRKVGNAVARNRAKRRLRALAREVLARHGQGGQDYVLIGRPETVTRPYELLRTDLMGAIARLAGHKGRGEASPRTRGKPQ